MAGSRTYLGTRASIRTLVPRAGYKQYRVRWKGYSEAHDSWEPVRNIHAPELVQEFLKRNTKREKKANMDNSLPTHIRIIASDPLTTSPLHSPPDTPTMPSRPSSPESIAYLQHAMGIDFGTDIAPKPPIDRSSPKLVPLAEAEEVDDLIRRADEEPVESIASPTPTTQVETITSPAPSDHASSHEETPTIESDPILPRPPLTHEDAIIHPGYPWIRARTFIGGDVQIPHPTGGLNDGARFLNPTTIYTTGEPVLYSTLSAGTPVYADELMVEP